MMIFFRDFVHSRTREKRRKRRINLEEKQDIGIKGELARHLIQWFQN